MEHDNRGRVVGFIHGGSRAVAAPAMPPAFRPRALRLVARPDVRLARVIEDGLRVQQTRGHLAAIDFLMEAKVSLRTIARVLWKPQLRRTGDA